ncbi:MAG: U32 family peptidase [Candidatus Ancaeobacter aquaticus]|nr:U32 family peptidase [Candidatus Ancaeobacter aquaticus]
MTHQEMSENSQNSFNTAKSELVAPAGRSASLRSAIYFGADAVYIGLNELSARMRAENFTVLQIKDAIAFVHAHGKKAYLAFNVLLKNSELDRACELLHEISHAGIDGVIIHDLGVYHILKKYFPNVPIHASTQMCCANVNDALEMEDLGFKRVILARELLLKEIEHIRSKTSIELEVFVHGALCFSYSGKCFLSSYIGGRSGNRGSCAQPCRQPYIVKGEKNPRYLMSTNDICLADDISRLIEAGVNAFKIEGRMKNEYYAACVSSFYRAIIDGSPKAKDIKEHIQLFYSREFAKDFLIKRKGELTQIAHPGNVGIDIGAVSHSDGRTITFETQRPIEAHDGIQIFHDGTLIDEFSVSGITINGKPVYTADKGKVVTVKYKGTVPQGAHVYLVSSIALKKAYTVPKSFKADTRYKIPIDMSVALDKKVLTISVAVRGKEKTFQFDVTPIKAEGKGTDELMLRTYLGRLGKTEFALRSLDACLPQSIFLQPSVLNEIRRELTGDIRKLLEEDTAACLSQMKKEIYINNEQCAEEPDRAKWIIKIDRIEYLNSLPIEKCEKIIIEIPHRDLTDTETRLIAHHKNKIVWALPYVKEIECDYESVVDSFMKRGFNRFQAVSMGDIQILKNKKVQFETDYPLYCLNALAGRQLIDMGASSFVVSPESSKRDLSEQLFRGLSKILIVYQDVLLCVSRYCVHKNVYTCGEKDKCMQAPIECENLARDRFSIYQRDCHSVVIGETPFSLSDKVEDLLNMGYSQLRIDFCFRQYAPGEISEVVNSVMNGKKLVSATSWNYNRVLY